MNNATDRKTPYTTMSLTPAARRVVQVVTARVTAKVESRVTASEVLHALCSTADLEAVASAVIENREARDEAQAETQA